jgi:uncharacterized protein (TIGR02246 family)
LSNQEVSKLFNLWNEALSSGNPKALTALYASDAILLPTISNEIRHNHDEIEDYFVQFLANEPKGELIEQNIRIFNELVINSGIYSFSLKDSTHIKARFSYVYQLLEGEWKIIEHHSSQMPE